ncbi:hypothetical protein UA08_04528 [Talaromyces atroroseus]|uniref:ER-bound oxygenase mpaB/mpaB'/Rubber oxygenase catalytic domain-containing protein n=1 Tax=Talaromyces atroroseus TaxID=1441469 RepID=A0A225ARY4_TALAT|nr:hypothetical protein UA08_04528 [Talaromyces atroroseus]OKL60038.1 hypothetical protein UA08_04528 [Talaromyces atroroseus]
MSFAQENNTSLFLPSAIPIPSSSILHPLLSFQSFKAMSGLDMNMDQLTMESVRRLGDALLSLDALPLSGLLCIFFLTLYLPLVRLLRFRRIGQLQKRYNYPTRASLAKMTDFEAWEIQRAMSRLEFPFTFEKSLQFALFRTYGIPTISGTLMKTKQFSNALYSGKRYVDTCVLIGEFIVHDPASIRARIGISRTKYLHHSYRKSGSVREEDMLYTLSLFATEPIRFINEYEWRSVTELERCALGVFWKSIGDALGIDYSAFLPTAKAAKEGGQASFKDGLEWLEEVTIWAQEYEKRAMIPAQSNRDTADQTTAVLTYSLPRSLKFIGNWFVSSMMDERLRLAMLYPSAPWLVKQTIPLLFGIRKVILRHLSLPRPEFLRFRNFADKPDPKTGAYHVVTWDAEPYYVKPTLWNRWLSPAAIVARLMRFPLPGDQGDKYYPQGYDLANMGPKTFDGKGKEYMASEMRTLEKERRGQCPFVQ